MIELVIFDMDGVLIDSEDAITKASVEALQGFYNIPCKYEDFKPFTGMGEKVFIGSVAEMYGVPFEENMRTQTYRIYCEKASERVTVYPWSNVLPKALTEHGFKVAVGSAADDIKVNCNISCIGLDRSLFSAIVTASEVVNKKPDPEIFLTCAKRAGIDPKNCLVFEDAVSGVMAAKAGGMKCIGITSSFDKQTLLDAGADMVVDTLDDGLRYVESLNN